MGILQNDTKTYLGYLVGERFWNIKFDEKRKPYLTSLHDDIKWQYREPIIALCSFLENVICDDNDIDHRCGIHAYKRLPNKRVPQYSISGKVALWGKVVVHEIGYRAEYAYLQSFIDSFCFTCNENKLIARVMFLGNFWGRSVCLSCFDSYNFKDHKSSLFEPIQGLKVVEELKELYGVS